MATLTESAGRTAAAVTRTTRAAWHAATYPYRQTVRALRRTGYGMARAYREAFLGVDQLLGPTIDADDPYYRRLSRSKRDLPEYTQQEQLRLAYGLWRTNPLARRILEITRDFVVGDGAQVSSDVEDVDALVHAFWHDPVNRMDTYLDELALHLGLAGELFVPAFVNPLDGSVRLGTLDPGDVQAVLCDPTNVRVPVAVKVRAETGQPPTYLAVIRVYDDPARPGAGMLMPNLEGETIVDPAEGPQPKPYAGAVFVFQINKPLSATRGTSDLLPLVDWVDGLDQAVWNSLDRIGFLNAFTWDVTLAGATQQACDARAAQLDTPKPGSLRVHNEKEVWTAVAPDLKMGDFGDGVRTHLNHIMGGAGLPSHWFGASDDVNRASAAEMSEPVLKRLTKRQFVVKHVAETLVRFAIDQAVLVGQLDAEYPTQDREGKAMKDDDGTAKTVAARDAFAVTLPELSRKDTTGLAGAANQLVQAVDAALAANLVSEHTGRLVMQNVLGQLGIEVDMQDEEAAIERERAARERKQQEQFQMKAQAGAMQLLPGGGQDSRQNGANGRVPAGGLN